MQFSILKLQRSVSSHGVMASAFKLGEAGVKFIEKRGDLVFVDKDGAPDVVFPWVLVLSGNPIEEDTEIEKALKKAVETDEAKKPAKKKVRRKLKSKSDE